MSSNQYCSVLVSQETFHAVLSAALLTFETVVGRFIQNGGGVSIDTALLHRIVKMCA